MLLPASFQNVRRKFRNVIDMGEGNIGVKLWLLFMLLVLSWFGIFNVLTDGYKLDIMLEANPQRYLSYIANAVLYLIVPPTIELAFIIISFSRKRKFGTEARSCRLILFGYGILFLFLSVYGILTTISSYHAALGTLTRSTRYLEGQILVIYATAATGFALWTLAGFLFMYLPTHSLYS